jgi:hypothetical protein
MSTRESITDLKGTANEMLKEYYANHGFRIYGCGEGRRILKKQINKKLRVYDIYSLLLPYFP